MSVFRLAVLSLLTGLTLSGSLCAEVHSRAAAFMAAMNSIEQSHLQRHVAYLADDTFEGREAGSRGGKAAGVYLAKLFAKHGLEPGGVSGGYFQPFGPGYRNILGVMPGADPKLKDEVIVVSAHYDHVGYGTQSNSYGPIGHIHNGADDNASGTSALLEIIEAFKMLPSPPRRTVLFALWDAEEKGLLGSKHWVSQPTLPLHQVRLMINMDMIGRLRNDLLEVYGVRSGVGMRQLLSEQNSDPSLRLAYTWEMKENSDHWSFFDKGVPVLMLHTGLHDDYHTPHDDTERINNDGMQRVARLLFATSYQLAQQDRLPAYRKEARHETVNQQQQLAKPLKPQPGRLGVTWAAEDALVISDAPQDGLLVTAVRAGSPAERAGLKRGDRIVGFNAQTVRDGEGFKRQVMTSGASAMLNIRRSGEDEPVSLPVELAGSPIRVGISWRTDDAEPGVVILRRITPGSPAHQAGLRVNDRIYQVNGTQPSTDEEFRQLLNSSNGKTTLGVERQGRMSDVVLELPKEVGTSAE